MIIGVGQVTGQASLHISHSTSLVLVVVLVVLVIESDAVELGCVSQVSPVIADSVFVYG